jgi:hypothetical protein
MTLSEYQFRAEQLNTKYNNDLHNLCMEYVNANKKYDIGDYLYNATSIIKVESISYNINRSSIIEITYTGYKYKLEKGVLVKTKCFNNTPETKEEKHLKSYTLLTL